MSQVQPELQNWTGGALNIIKLIGKAPSFATLCWKFKTGKIRYHYFQNWHFWDLGCIFVIKMMMKSCLGVIRFEIGALFEEKKLKKKFFKNQNSALCSTQWPPDVLDHLVIGLVDTKYTKLGKIGGKLLLILGLAHINFPLC